MVSIQLRYEGEKEEKEDLKKQNESLRKRLEGENKYRELEIPKPSEEVRERLKALPSHAVDTLVDYLILDTYELVKNLAGITNKDNVSEVIAYRDGAVQRNEALIQALRKVRTKTEYTDRIEGEVKGIKKEPKKEL